MSNVIMNVFKGQRMDITAQMKDADSVIEIFKIHHIRFGKKYTSINQDGPSTITFKDLKWTNEPGDLGAMISTLYSSAAEDVIGDVTIKFTSHPYQKKSENPVFVTGMSVKEDAAAPEAVSYTTTAASSTEQSTDAS